MVTELQKYIADKNKSSGYVLYHHSDDNVAGPSTWELHIAIEPTREALDKAAEVVARICIEQGVDFKCFVLNDEDTKKNDAALDAWHGAFNEAGSDRDRRGQEICITIPYQLSASEIKELMLRLWKALLAADVKMGYTASSFGDKGIEFTGRGLELATPFSYTAYKPPQSKHGILHQAFESHKGGKDPFKGIVITARDLERHGIHKEAVLARHQATYIQQEIYVTHGNIWLRQDVLSLFNQVVTRVSSEVLVNELATLNSALQDSTLDSFNAAASTLKQDLLWAVKKCPHRHDAGLKQSALSGYIADCLSRCPIIDEATFNEIKNAMTKLVEDRDGDQKKLIAEVKSDWREKAVQSFVEKNELSFSLISLIDLMIDTDPYRMQVLYRRLIHVVHAQQGLGLLLQTKPAEAISSRCNLTDFLGDQKASLSIEKLKEELAKESSVVTRLLLLEQAFIDILFDPKNQYSLPKPPAFSFFHSKNDDLSNRQLSDIKILKQAYLAVMQDAKEANVETAAVAATASNSKLLDFNRGRVAKEITHSRHDANALIEAMTSDSAKTNRKGFGSS